MSKGGGYLSSKEMRRGRLASSASLFGVSPGAALASASLRSRSRAADASSRRSRSATRASRGSTWPARCSSLMMVAWMFASSKSMPLSSAAASPAPLCELASSSTATAGAGSGASHPAWDAPSSSVASLRDRLRWYWSSEHPKLLDMRASSSGAAGAAPRAAAMAASTADSPTALRSPADAASAADASSSSSRCASFFFLVPRSMPPTFFAPLARSCCLCRSCDASISRSRRRWRWIAFSRVSSSS
mmetsp:Transcript_8518/g.29112  ORF Transcript_8518/g.29112 Transcript_8518/m.29112 type:complete len:246 (+) Transcript_8518:188-925(+)